MSSFAFAIKPSEFDIAEAPLSAIQVTDAKDSLAMIRGVLDNQAGPALDIVALNAGAAIYVAGLEATLSDGAAKARQVIADGSAAAKLAALVEKTQSYSEQKG